MLPATTDGRKPVPTGRTVLVPYLGLVVLPEEGWEPTRPGPQPHNIGIAPGVYRRDRRSAPRPHLGERVSEAEALLAEALCRLAQIEADRAAGVRW